ncbi:MAG: hypothetical protein IJG37_07070 [Synergistaceae bacterium]|nr:hypothetical protein [Synergistaceae bacterium]
MKKFLVSIFFAIVLSVTGAYSAERAIQVTQPVYYNMKFYVYKPVNVPRDFYVTFDGYLVYRDSKGIWNYGSNEKGGISKTNYVVGTVIPSVVRLKPYSTKISSVAPLLRETTQQKSPQTYSAQTLQPQSSQTPKSPRIVYMPPASGLELYNAPVLSPNNPDWTQNSNFMAIGRWQNSIDRIGVLNRPMIPVAWKGDYPDAVYAWTGLQWRQLDAKSKHIPALSTLRRQAYDLNRYVRKVNMHRWTDDDTHVLSQYSVMWGYEWMGLLILGKEY